MGGLDSLSPPGGVARRRGRRITSGHGASGLWILDPHTGGFSRFGVPLASSTEGQSLIVRPRGRTLAGPASRDRPETLTALVDLDEAARAKHLNAFDSPLRDRRADVSG